MPGRSKAQLIGELVKEIREEQEDVQAFDEAAAKLLGINLTDLRVLGIVDRLGRVSPGQLAAEARLTTGTITALVDRLERAGYACRFRDEADRRRVFVVLTDLVRERMALIWGPVAEEGFELAQRYSVGELELLVQHHRESRELLQRHRERLEEMAEK